MVVMCDIRVGVISTIPRCTGGAILRTIVFLPMYGLHTYLYIL